MIPCECLRCCSWDATQSALTIVFTQFPAAAPVANASCAVGTLRFSVNPAAGLTTFDGESVPSNFNGTVSVGSWGDLPQSVQVLEESPTRARVLAFPPLGVGYAVSRYLIEWSRFSTFNDTADTGSSANESASAAQDISYQVVNLLPATPYYFRVAASSDNPSVFGPFFTVPSPLALRLPVISSVVTSAGGSNGDANLAMATGGGQSLRITGINLGVVPPSDTDPPPTVASVRCLLHSQLCCCVERQWFMLLRFLVCVLWVAFGCHVRGPGVVRQRPVQVQRHRLQGDSEPQRSHVLQRAGRWYEPSLLDSGACCAALCLPPPPW